MLPGILYQPQPRNTGGVSVEIQGHRGQRKLYPPTPTPPPSEQWALLLPRDEEEEAGPGLGRI